PPELKGELRLLKAAKQLLRHGRRGKAGHVGRARPAEPVGVDGRRLPEPGAIALEADAPEGDRVAGADRERSRDDAQAVALLDLPDQVGETLRLEGGLGYLPHPAHQPALFPAPQHEAIAPLDEGGRDGDLD